VSEAKRYILPESIYPVVLTRPSLDEPHWVAARNEELHIQRCKHCRRFQWGPEFLCHHCHSFDLGFERVSPSGTIYSWERVWHPVSPEVQPYVPYVILVVELDDAPGIYATGNLVGDPTVEIPIGAQVAAAFEHHDDYTLVQWRLAQ